MSKNKFDIIVNENTFMVSQEIFKAANLRSENGYMVFSFEPNMEKVRTDKKSFFSIQYG